MSNKSRRGISLLEVVVSSLLVGTVVVGSLVLLGASVRTRATAENLITGPRLAEDLLAEIMAMPYDEPDGAAASGLDAGESGTTRVDFDDVDDYQDWDGSNIQAKDGTPIPNSAGWTRTVSIWWVDPATGNIDNSSDSGVKRIRVSVTSPNGGETKRCAMRSRWGSLQQPPTTDTTVITRVDLTLTVGTTANNLRASTQLLNHVEDPNGS